MLIYVWLYLYHKAQANETNKLVYMVPAGSSTRLTLRQPYWLLESLQERIQYFTVLINAELKALEALHDVLMNSISVLWLALL